MKDVAVGGTHILFLTNLNELYWCGGEQYQGQANIALPTRIHIDSNATILQIGAMGGHSYVLMEDYRVFSMYYGPNRNGTWVARSREYVPLSTLKIEKMSLRSDFGLFLTIESKIFATTQQVLHITHL